MAATADSSTPPTQTPTRTLIGVDYAVMVVVLAVPTIIGIVYAFKDRRKMTRLEYLFGGQKMTLVPVTLSIFVTFQVIYYHIKKVFAKDGSS